MNSSGKMVYAYDASISGQGTGELIGIGWILTVRFEGPRKIASYWSRQSAVWIAATVGAAVSAEALPAVLASRRSVLLPK